MHRVDVAARHDLAEVTIGLAVLVVVLLVHAVREGLANVPLGVADGNILDVVTAQEGTQIAATHVAEPDAGHHDAVARRHGPGIAHRRRRDQVGKRHRCRRYLQKCSSTGRHAPVFCWFAPLLCHVSVLSWGQWE